MKTYTGEWKVRRKISESYIKSVWRRGPEVVYLEWSGGYYQGHLEIRWTRGRAERWVGGAALYRRDGPSLVFGYAIEIEDALRLSELDDPRSIDNWLRKHETHLFWNVVNCEIHKEVGLLTYQFPDITTEFIRKKIEDGPEIFENGPDSYEHITDWLRVARHLGLMDDGLRKLAKNVQLTMDVPSYMQGRRGCA